MRSRVGGLGATAERTSLVVALLVIKRPIAMSIWNKVLTGLILVTSLVFFYLVAPVPDP